jgi:hypothetical protein
MAVDSTHRLLHGQAHRRSICWLHNALGSKLRASRGLSWPVNSQGFPNASECAHACSSAASTGPVCSLSLLRGAVRFRSFGHSTFTALCSFPWPRCHRKGRRFRRNLRRIDTRILARLRVAGLAKPVRPREIGVTFLATFKRTQVVSLAPQLNAYAFDKYCFDTHAPIVYQHIPHVATWETKAPSGT